MTEISRQGYRGYITSRPFFGERAPQHVQNLVIRDYCARRALHYLLSATEYAMAGSAMMLEAVLDELPRLDGIVLYSIFLLPTHPDKRRAIYERTFVAGCSLHGAVEDFPIYTEDDARRVEDLWLVRQFVDRVRKEG
jgi:sporadic carbohydrate cluster protein (TIGR04323 family)